MKKRIIMLSAAIVMLITSNEKIKAQDLTRLGADAAGGVGGFLIGNHFGGATGGLIGGGAGALITDFAMSAFQHKSDRDKLEYYISGRNYERWVESQKTWYTSTLDPYTGRPQAFSGLGYMDVGMPPSAPVENKEDAGINVPVKIPAGTYGGVPKVARTVEFPKLP